MSGLTNGSDWSTRHTTENVEVGCAKLELVNLHVPNREEEMKHYRSSSALQQQHPQYIPTKCGLEDFFCLRSRKMKCTFGGFKGVQKKHCNCHRTYTSRNWGYCRSYPDCFFEANISNQTVTMFALRVLHQLISQMTLLFHAYNYLINLHFRTQNL